MKNHENTVHETSPMKMAWRGLGNGQLPSDEERNFMKQFSQWKMSGGSLRRWNKNVKESLWWPMCCGVVIQDIYVVPRSSVRDSALCVPSKVSKAAIFQATFSRDHRLYSAGDKFILRLQVPDEHDLFTLSEVCAGIGALVGRQGY